MKPSRLREGWVGMQLPKRNCFARQRVTESILPYIREVLTLSKQSTRRRLFEARKRELKLSH